MNLRDPLATARGLGSAKDGVQHWWMQRLTAIVLALLSPWFIYFAVAQIGADQFQVRNAIAEPLNATLLLGFVIAMMWHARLGLQVVVEDYIHGWLEIALQIAIKLVYAFATIAAVIAIGRIAFAAQ
ncbi:MAG TPA: succinate dehydrogenase, hydrophobic membrane anchor protein [Arenimonas sp.]|uniref:succinate dehydrogenase, hydrophobic membrane anchor protein n=1 Tax=Arenimonas sp. TaxID=1872635 RepID=UPI002B8B4059|nr:succinate dehydrogenase, hydrophobic membrane anchor protein [Arenimonas sp.]HMB57325.1 succinate dehydrogenase, hydrophobic membrane anchor protein [Arenimonas sp.]